MDIEIVTLAQRPDLADEIWFEDVWPVFMQQDPVGAYFGRIHETFPGYTFAALDPDGAVVARAHSVPFQLRADERQALPPSGWDRILIWAFRDHRAGAVPDTVSAAEVAIRADHLGTGLSALMVAAMRDNARAAGFSELVAPVRPNGKHTEPLTPMSEYAFRTRADGLPEDPWLRVHVRAGAVIDSVAPTSMVVPGTLAQWRDWTGLPFDTDGWVTVPGALTPVRCVPGHDYAVYVEPNVWVRHRL